MKYGKWVRNLTFVAAIGALCLQSCRRENGIDNNNVIRTPYSLYYGDSEGGVENTNDGTSYKRIFPYDGIPVRSVVTSGTNILFVKRNAHLSMDNGENFNPTNTNVAAFSFHQSMLVNITSHNRLYLCTNNLLDRGLSYSEDNGKTWASDGNWDKNITGYVQPTSLAQLKTGDLFALSSAGLTNRLFKRTGKDEQWVEVTTAGLPSTGFLFLSRLNDALLAADATGGGIYYSLDKGANWFQYNSTPAEPANDVYAPFDQTLLVGTSQGMYRLVAGAFIPANSGLELGTEVYSIVGKADTYKNEVIKRYVYIATSTGLYRSEDLGQNWILMKEGDIRIVY